MNTKWHRLEEVEQNKTKLKINTCEHKCNEEFDTVKYFSLKKPFFRSLLLWNLDTKKKM